MIPQLLIIHKVFLLKKYSQENDALRSNFERWAAVIYSLLTDRFLKLSYSCIIEGLFQWLLLD